MLYSAPTPFTISLHRDPCTCPKSVKQDNRHSKQPIALALKKISFVVWNPRKLSQRNLIQCLGRRTDDPVDCVRFSLPWSFSISSRTAFRSVRGTYLIISTRHKNLKKLIKFASNAIESRSPPFVNSIVALQQRRPGSH